MPNKLKCQRSVYLNILDNFLFCNGLFKLYMTIYIKKKTVFLYLLQRCSILSPYIILLFTLKFTVRQIHYTQTFQYEE